MKIQLIILVITFFACTSQNNNKNSAQNSFSKQLLTDKTNFTLFETDFMKSPFFSSDCRVLEITENDLLVSEKLIDEFVAEYNKKQRDEVDSLQRYFAQQNLAFTPDPDMHFIDLKKYGRQYLKVKTSENQEIIFINFFCDPELFENRDKEWVIVDDGGKCFFKLKIDMTDNEIIENTINGFG